MKIFFTLLWSLISLLPIELEKRKFLNDKIEVLIPKGFSPMSQEMLDLKYKGQNKPTLVLTDKDGTVNIAINLLPNPANETLVESYKNSILASYEKSFPKAIWKGEGITLVNGRKVGYLKLVTDAIDQKIYNYVFLTYCDGKLLIGTFNCIEKLLPEWESTSEQIIQSLKIN